jgi:hypothetical protein
MSVLPRLTNRRTRGLQQALTERHREACLTPSVDSSSAYSLRNSRTAIR